MKLFAGLSVALAAAVALVGCSDRKLTMIMLPESLPYPSIACSAEELSRLREAWVSTGSAHEAVAAEVARGDAALAEELVFPPRGGQHNARYQCDDCQMGLETLDATHHRCPKCGKVYSGHPYDDVVFRAVHRKNLQNGLAAAWAYAITGEVRYAAFCRDVLVGYGERYLQYPLHNPWLSDEPRGQRLGGHIFPQTLDESMALAEEIGPAYDLIRVWAGLTDADRERIEQGLIAPMIKRLDANKMGKSNWQSWHNAGLFAGAMMLGDRDLARRTIDDADNGFLYQMTASISEEGMHHEGSWGYHFYTLNSLVILAESARRVGVDLWAHDRLEKMFLLPLDYRMADGSLPCFADSPRGKHPRPPHVEAAYRAYGDARLLSYLGEEVTWESVLYGRDVSESVAPAPPTSRVVPEAGHAILRTGGQAGLTSAFAFGPFGGSHGHYDKLSFALFGYGRELGVDHGCATSQAYRLPIHEGWYRATLSHNAVVVDGVPQAPAQGELLAFDSAGPAVLVAADAGPIYEGVRHRRLLCQTARYLLVVDDLQADAPRRFDWLYHNVGEGVLCRDATADGQFGREYRGQEYVKNIRCGESDETIGVCFPGPAGATYLTAAGATGTRVCVGDGPGGSVLERIPLVMLTREGQAVRFACAIEPTESDAAPVVTDVRCERGDSGLTVTVTAGSSVDTVTWDGGDRFEFTPGR